MTFQGRFKAILVERERYLLELALHNKTARLVDVIEARDFLHTAQPTAA